MSPLPPVVPLDAMRPSLPAEPALQAATQTPQAMQPQQIDAFSASLNSSPLSVNPDAIGRSLLSGLGGFNADETQFRTTVGQAVDGTGAGSNAAGEAAPPAQGITAAEMMDRGNALQQRSMGVMMQTYSFALEASLVTNAATTFTSSINTLIKTQ